MPTNVLAIALSALGRQSLLAAQTSQTACWLSLGAWGFARAGRRGRSLPRQMGAGLLSIALRFVVALIEFLLIE